MKWRVLWTYGLIVCLCGSSSLRAQQANPAPNAGQPKPGLAASSLTLDSVLSRLIRIDGVVKDGAGKVVSGATWLTFSIYQFPEGGRPLWVESQQVTAYEHGRYTAILGAGPPVGLALDVFASGQAHWLGVQPQLAGAGEPPRVLLVGVLYPLKAADGETLESRPASAFVTTGAAGPRGGVLSLNSAAPRAGRTRAADSMGMQSATIGGGGTANYVPLWTDTSTLGNSALFQSGANVGIGTTSPTASLDVKSNSFSPAVRGGSSSGPGVVGNSSENTGVLGMSSSASGVYGQSDSSRGVSGTSNTDIGVYGQSDGNPGVFGTSNNAAGVEGQSDSSTGVLGSSHSGAGVFGQSDRDAALKGLSHSGIGVQGTAEGGLPAVEGRNEANGDGVTGSSANGDGVVGMASSIGNGVVGSSSNLAGLFMGNVSVSGALSATTKNFLIDDPLDPANQYLYHASVESSEMKTIYDGLVTLDTRGEAVVELPRWFEALNRDFRYQLTAVGAPGRGLYIAEEIAHHHFKIAGGRPGLKVSWQVTGVRQDAFAKAHPLQVEVEKPKKERGYYIHPELYGAPEEKGIQWVRQPELMKRIKEMRARPVKPMQPTPPQGDG